MIVLRELPHGLETDQTSTKQGREVLTLGSTGQTMIHLWQDPVRSRETWVLTLEHSGCKLELEIRARNGSFSLCDSL